MNVYAFLYFHVILVYRISLIVVFLSISRLPDILNVSGLGSCRDWFANTRSTSGGAH